MTADQPYDVYRHLTGPTAELASSLATWACRDDTRPQPEIRQAANTAMDAIDTMLRELHAIRARLGGEIRAADDAAMARTGELLRRIRDDGGPPARM